MAYRTIDLFAGAGGLTAGFWLARDSTGAELYDPVFAVEHEPAAAATYKANFGIHVHDGDIEFMDPRVYPSADIIIGGPPCQGFSPLGRDRDPDSKAALNGLWEHFLAAVVQVRPRAFVIENVPQFQRSAQFNELLDRMANHPLPVAVRLWLRGTECRGLRGAADQETGHLHGGLQTVRALASSADARRLPDVRATVSHSARRDRRPSSRTHHGSTHHSRQRLPGSPSPTQPAGNLPAALPGYPTGREPLRSAAQSARHNAGLLAQQTHGHY